MGSKKNRSLLRDLMNDLKNSVLDKNDLSIMFGGTTNHNKDNSGIVDDVPQ